MKTIEAQPTMNVDSRKALLAGRIITGLCILFLLVDAILKVVKATPSTEGSAQLGWPENALQGAGIVLLLATVLYTIPRTAIIGALLVTTYLGGATAIMVRAGQPSFFPVVFGILIWAGLYLSNRKVRALLS